MIWLTTALAWTPAEQTLIRTLSHRDGTPACAEMTQGFEDPVAILNKIVDEVARPPWAPMRAAICLIDAHESASEATMLSWVADPEKKGLAKLVLRRLGTMQSARAARIESAALRGPLSAEARSILQPQ